MNLEEDARQIKKDTNWGRGDQTYHSCHVGHNKTSKHLAVDNVCVQCVSDSFEKTLHYLHRPHVAEDCYKYWSWEK